MPEQNDDRAARIFAEAEQLIKEVQGQLEASEKFCRQVGLTPSDLEGAMSAEMKSVAEQLVAADLAAVERDVTEGKTLALTRPRFYKPETSHRVAKNRRMV